MTTLTHDSEVDVRAGRRLGLGLALTSAGTFGLSGTLASGLMTTGWSPAAVVACRTGIAALGLLPFLLMSLRGRWHVLRDNARALLAYGAVPVAGTQLAYFSAVDRMPVSVALLVEYTAPVAVIGWLWLRHGQRPGRTTVAGTALAAVGLVGVLDLLSGASVDALGVLFALLACVGAATYFVMSASPGASLQPMVLAGGGLLVGTVVLLLAGLSGVVPMHGSTAPASYDGHEVVWWLPLVGLGLVTAAVPYVTGIAATRRLGSRLASFVALSEVLFAVVFAWLLLGQVPHPVQVLGGVLVLAGVVLVRAGEPADLSER